VLGAILLGLRVAPDERGVHVDQVVEAQDRVDERLDALDAIAIHVLARLRRVVRHDVHHLSGRLAEPKVVLEEVAVAVDVRHDELLLGQRVAAHQVRVAGVVVDHELVDLREAVGVALGELLVLHAEAPVRVARREAAVGRDHVELLAVDQLEDDLVEVEAVALRDLADLVAVLRQLWSQVAHVSRSRAGSVVVICPCPGTP
jgi:hypothetical protein